MEKDQSSILKLSGLSAIIASLCCLSPLILVMLGLASVSFAASLSDLFYGTYKWLFRLAGLIFLSLFLILYYRRKGICTFDQVKRNRKKLINEILLALIAGIIFYIIFLYFIVEYIGQLYGIWR